MSTSDQNKINGTIDTLFNETFNTSVEQIEWLSVGSYNKVYKIITEDKSYILRIFPKGGTQNVDDIKLLESHLLAAGVKTPKTLFCSSDNKYFPYGCSILEYIPSSTAKELLNEGVIKLEDYYYNLGKEIRKVHSIKFEKFGSLSQKGLKSYKFFSKYKLKELEEKITSLKEIPHTEIKVGVLKLFSEVKDELEGMDGKFKPVLNHGDINSNNILINNQGDYYIIDWDYAAAGIWLQDFANMTYWSSKITSNIKEEFMKGYGNTGLSSEEITNYGKLFHKIIAIGHIKWLYLDENEVEECKIVLSRFNL